MIFFIFSLIASFAGSLKSGNLFPVSFNFTLSVGNSLSGLISFWPFIIVLLLFLLAILWFQTIRNIRTNKTRTSRKQQRGQSVIFLSVLTVAILLLVAAPYYLRTLNSQDTNTTRSEDQIELVLRVHGMDCSGCEQLVNRRVGQLAGVDSVRASHTREEVFVLYDRSRVSLGEIANSIEEAGYTVVME
jgi:copper chaperone CopZ